MELINFDKHFHDYLSGWMDTHTDDYKDFDAMEQDMPHVYKCFLNTPASWLEGITPGAYFSQFDDCKELVDWMIAYTAQRVPLPSPLLDRIVEVGLPCERRLLILVKDDCAPVEARMTAIGLLREMESILPKSLYIAWIEKRGENDELCDNALESLRQMGHDAIGPMTQSIRRATSCGQEAMLNILADYPGNESVFQIALRLFIQHPDRCAIFAGYLGKLGDERALPALTQAAQAPHLSYLDYIEIRCAIERLGGDVPPRCFDCDPEDSEMLRRMNE
jgi:hypothetical protein